MTEEFNIIGDIAGNFLSLQALLKKMPSSAIPFSIGDMCDRGPRSKEVFYFFKENGKALLGNHDHIMLCEVTNNPYYQVGTWYANGGFETLKSLFPEIKNEYAIQDIVSFQKFLFNNSFSYLEDYLESKTARSNKELLDNYYNKIDQELIKWISTLPLYYETEDLFLSHAPKRPDFTLLQCIKLGEDYRDCDDTLLWNRGSPRRLKNKIQIFGHNSFRKVHEFKDRSGVFAYGIDTSSSGKLSGIHWPSLEIFEQEIID